MTPSRRPRSPGFSTAEVLVGMTLSLLAVGTLYSFLQAQQKAHATQRTYSQSQTVTRTAIDLMTRELRMATFDPTIPGALTTSQPPNCPGVKQGLVEATPSKIHFKQDLDGNGLLTGSSEDIVYDVLGSQIRRTDGAALPIPIVDYIPAGGLNFRYFDGSNPPNELVPAGTPPHLTPEQRDCVTKVRVTVRANLPNPNPRLTTPVTSVAESEIAIRNRSLANF